MPRHFLAGHTDIFLWCPRSRA